MTSIWLQAAFLAGLTGMALGLDDPSPSQCWDDYVDHKHECQDNFSSDDHPDYQNSNAYQTCVDGANAAYETCQNGGDGDDVWAAWQQFLNRLSFCITDNPNDSIGLTSCLRVALSELQHALDDILNPDDDDCGPGDNGVQQMSPIYTLEQGAIQAGRTDSKYPARVNSTVTFAAGVNPGGGTPYNVGDQPCMKTAVSIAIYATKDGPEVIVYDGDTDTSDGVTFSLALFQSELVDTQEVHIVNVYFDQNAMPRFAELGTLAIETSPLSGDWNRDNVTDTQDLIDFLGTFSAQASRADINGDGEINELDAGAFIQQYSE